MTSPSIPSTIPGGRRRDRPAGSVKRGTFALALDTAGSTAVEFAFVGPLLLLMMFGVIEFGRALWTENALQYAVAEAARCMTVNTNLCGSPSQTQAFAATRSGLSLPASVFTAGRAFCGNKVSARYSFEPLLGLLPYPVTLTAQSCFPA